VSHGDISTPREPSIVVHPVTGNFTAVWIRNDASLGDHVWTRSRSGAIDGAWGSLPDCVGPDLRCGEDAPRIRNLRIAAGTPNNLAIITWDALTSGGRQIWARRMINGRFGGGPALVSHGNINGTNEYDSRAVFDRNETAYVVWTLALSGRSTISMRRILPNGTRLDIESLTDSGSGNADLPALASNGSIAENAADSVWVVWLQQNGTQEQVWGWKVGSGDPTMRRRPISTAGNSNTTGNIRIATDRAGNAHALWTQSQRFTSSRYNGLLDAWGEPVTSTDVVSPPIGLEINGSGDAIAWWKQLGADPANAGRLALQTRRFE
jgi:hypothetical protein